MRIGLLSGVVAVASILGTVAASVPAPETLPAPARKELEARFREYAKATTDEARAAVFPLLFVHGRRGCDFIETLASKQGLADAASAVRSKAPEILGFDILREAVPGARPEYAPNWFAPGEVVLLKTETLFAGFSVDRASKADQGEITVAWWSQTGNLKARALAQPGGKKGTLTVKGAEAAKPLRRNTGWKEFEYSFEVEGIPVGLRSSGPALFRHRYPEGASIALAGELDPRMISTSDASIVYVSAYPETLVKIQALLAKYLYSTLPGCVPLPLEGAEKEEFSQYEQLQVDVRETRAKAEPVVLVRLLELEPSGFRPYHRAYIVQFVNEIVRVADERVIVMAGDSPGFEGNRFIEGDSFERPSKKLIECLRANFPEGS